jgi:hypothetical protein
MEVLLRPLRNLCDFCVRQPAFLLGQAGLLRMTAWLLAIAARFLA